VINSTCNNIAVTSWRWVHEWTKMKDRQAANDLQSVTDFFITKRHYNWKTK